MVDLFTFGLNALISLNFEREKLREVNKLRPAGIGECLQNVKYLARG